MDYLIQSDQLMGPYKLSHKEEGLNWIVEKEILQLCGERDLLVLDNLYRSYKKNLKGVILNTEEDFNLQLSVSLFLGALCKTLKDQVLILILCSNEAIKKWHYYMNCSIKDAQFHVNLDFSLDTNKVKTGILIISFSKTKVLESCLMKNFSVVIIDKFDHMAQKRIISRLHGHFNIGITYRNFYIEPDQKLQWSMLNWANPNSVGKASNFYEIDNENFAQFRNNYKEWWFRFTLSYSDFFKSSDIKEKEIFNTKLREPPLSHELSMYYLKETEKQQFGPSKRQKKNSTSNVNPPNIPQHDDNKDQIGNYLNSNSISKEHMFCGLSLEKNLLHKEKSEMQPSATKPEMKPSQIKTADGRSGGENFLFSLVENNNNCLNFSNDNNDSFDNEDESVKFLKSLVHQ